MARHANEPHGILLVHKPEGPTSFDVVAHVRRSLRTRTVGHAGTLDPLASGLLVVLVGKYTRLSAYLTDKDKSYRAVVQFGSRTSTDDREGEAVEVADPALLAALSENTVREALARFQGEQKQIPPMYAAISVAGERLYMKARRGEVIEVEPRSIRIDKIEMISWDDEKKCAVVDVTCSKGTYIRSLARDVGAALGVPAHLGGLLRTASGSYLLSDAVDLAQWRQHENPAQFLQRGISALPDMQHREVTDDEKADIKNGKMIKAHELSAHLSSDTTINPQTEKLAVAYDRRENGELIALIEPIFVSSQTSAQASASHSANTPATGEGAWFWRVVRGLWDNQLAE